MWGQASVGTTLWSEDFSGYAADDVPSGEITNSHTGTTVYGDVTLTYACEKGGTDTKIYNDKSGPNTSSNNLNLLVSKSNGTFSVSGISTGGATELTLSYGKAGSGTLAVSSSTTGVTISGSTITTNGASTLQLTFKNTNGSKNLRIDDIVVTVKTAGSSSSAEATTTTIDASGITNTNVYAGTAAGSLSATVKDNSDDEIDGATVTWSGDNDAVATINATTGAVTLVGAGTVTFTAIYAGVEDEYSSSSDTYEMTVINEDPSLVTIWSENFSTYSANDVPADGTYNYACTNGGGTTKIYTQSTAGGTSPELLVGKNNGTFSATIPLLHPTYGYSGDLTLSFKSNTTINVKTTTDGITVDGEATEGAGVTFATKDTHTVTFKGVTTVTGNITVVFTATTGDNVRLDDIELKGKQAALTVVATPSILPADGAVVSGTEVTMTCGTDGATIYYTTDGSTPSSGSTAYNPSSKPTITSACTIKAIGIKDGLTDSEVASATYTIAEPCATPTFSVAEGVVDKGTTVTISCGTADATIYYTTNGDTPTTSSSVYISALTINTAQTIKAIAVKDGYANSEVASVAYTIRDYATLPFVYDGNGLGEFPSGLTQSGLTGKYDNSPKMKFDTTDDYVILKIGQTAGLLYFDVKGNPSSGSWTGTFKVQTSTDGSSYDDLAVYEDNLSSTKETKTLTVPSDARYIKWILSDRKANVALGNIKLTGCESVSVTSAGYTTYTTTDKVTFPSGVKGYIVTATGDNNVTLEEKTSVPASTPIIIEASTGTYNLPVITTTPEDVSDNILLASDGTIEGDGSTIFALGNKSGVGFYLVANGQTVPAGKAYLSVPAAVKGFLAFDFGDIDAIKTVQGAGLKDAAIFNLAGQRMSRMHRGVNLVNGKKFILK